MCRVFDVLGKIYDNLDLDEFIKLDNFCIGLSITCLSITMFILVLLREFYLKGILGSGIYLNAFVIADCILFVIMLVIIGILES